MEFESDPQKSEANKAKHGIEFVAAQVLRYDPNKRTIAASCREEVRLVTFGSIEGVVWTGVFTLRGNRIRIISVRRARKAERLIYGQDHGCRIRSRV